MMVTQNLIELQQCMSLVCSRGQGSAPARTVNGLLTAGGAGADPADARMASSFSSARSIAEAIVDASKLRAVVDNTSDCSCCLEVSC